jgi:hypothetical protein
MAKTRFKVGDTVRVVGERGTSKIRALLPEVNGVLLETKIGRYRNWNLDELRLVKRAKKKHSIMRASSRARIKAAGMARERKTNPEEKHTAPAEPKSPAAEREPN